MRRRAVSVDTGGIIVKLYVNLNYNITLPSSCKLVDSVQNFIANSCSDNKLTVEILTELEKRFRELLLKIFDTEL